MQDTNLSKYFYGDEAMQFSYFRIPRQLITHPRFKPILLLGRQLLRGEAQDIDSGGLALALPDALDQARAFAGVQFGQQLHGLVSSAVQIPATGRDIRCVEAGKTDPNYNNINQTDFIYTNQSINPPAPMTYRTCSPSS